MYTCNQGAWPLREASFPGAVSSHGADPAAPGRGTLPTGWHWWQYLRGSRWPSGAVHPWECKTTGLTTTLTASQKFHTQRWFRTCFLFCCCCLLCSKGKMLKVLKPLLLLWLLFHSHVEICFLTAGWYRRCGEGSFTRRQCSQFAQYPGHHHCTSSFPYIICLYSRTNF